MKIVTILGARPQFIKASTFSRAIQKDSDIEEIIVHTGQHYDENMSSVFFEEMKIPEPKYQLGIGGGTHAEMTGKMLIKLEKILIKEKPDWVIVFGDTNSTLAGALAATKLNIKIAHIESGLRSFNNQMPEEINRILTDRISDLLFCPTIAAEENLIKEGFLNYQCKIVQVGDIMKEGARYFRSFATPPPNIIFDKPFKLVTIHRAENTNDSNKLFTIFKALNELGNSSRIIMPIHPRTKKRVDELKINTDNIEIIDPLGYIEMIWMINNCDGVITDSGGLQKEAYFFSKPCVTLRDETEWKELVNNNFNVLVGSNYDKIIHALTSHKFNDDFSLELYGGNNITSLIISELKKATI
tara:strand:- start:13904 stop:14971 length:1068 start_codon:yes stop_codon:yes gene_type:complete